MAAFSFVDESLDDVTFTQRYCENGFKIDRTDINSYRITAVFQSSQIRRTTDNCSCLILPRGNSSPERIRMITDESSNALIFLNPEMPSFEKGLPLGFIQISYNVGKMSRPLLTVNVKDIKELYLTTDEEFHVLFGMFVFKCIS